MNERKIKAICVKIQSYMKSKNKSLMFNRIIVIILLIATVELYVGSFMFR